MRSLAIAIFYAFISACLWLLASFLLSYYAELSFAEALLVGVPTGRLALRIFICGLVLIFGALKLAQHRRSNALQGRHYEQRRSEDLLYGSTESRSKSERVLYHCLNLAAYFNMPQADREALRVLCYCYDIGKVSLASSLLKKQARTAAEQSSYDMHTLYGAEIAAAFEDTKGAAELIKYHHELFNGGGVHGIKGAQIPLGCRIFAVAWAYDSMVNPQKRKRSHICDEALRELKYYEGTAFDPVVVEAFIRIMGKRDIKAGIGNTEFSTTAN